MMFLLALLVIGGFLIYVMKPEERVKLLQSALAIARQIAEEAVRRWREREPDPFHDALRARTRGRS